jgi:hypothetical protein
MTTLATWAGVDQRGPASIYVVADSRMTWSPETWDHGRKLFASRTSADVIGYCGDAFFPTQTLSQIIDLIDAGVIPSTRMSAEARLEWILDLIERSAKRYPRSIAKDFELLYAAREGEGMGCKFSVRHIRFTAGHGTPPTVIPVPSYSSLLEAFGTGGRAFKKEVLPRWQASEIGGTSRAVFSAFSEHLQHGSDPFTGGPPQLVGLYRTGPARIFGIVWDQKRFVAGMEVPELDTSASVRWHNDLFEICDAISLSRVAGAQPQPRPRSLDRRPTKYS